MSALFLFGLLCLALVLLSVVNLIRSDKVYDFLYSIFAIFYVLHSMWIVDKITDQTTMSNTIYFDGKDDQLIMSNPRRAFVHNFGDTLEPGWYIVTNLKINDESFFYFPPRVTEIRKCPVCNDGDK